MYVTLILRVNANFFYYYLGLLCLLFREDRTVDSEGNRATDMQKSGHRLDLNPGHPQAEKL